MNIEVRGAAKVTYGDGHVGYATYSPDVRPMPHEAEVLATVVGLCLKGDITSVEPAIVRVTIEGGEGLKGYRVLGEVAASSSLAPPTELYQ